MDLNVPYEYASSTPYDFKLVENNGVKTCSYDIASLNKQHSTVMNNINDSKRDKIMNDDLDLNVETVRLSEDEKDKNESIFVRKYFKDLNVLTLT